MFVSLLARMSLFKKHLKLFKHLICLLLASSFCFLSILLYCHFLETVFEEYAEATE